MKVGVFLEEFSPNVGGGYTIQQDIFESLVELAEGSRHTFAVFCRRPEELTNAIRSNRLELIAFPGTLAQRVVSRAGRGFAVFRGKRSLQTRLEQLAQRTGIEFMWFVGAEAVQLDIPYLAIVWDLQHRLQPWFPEVGEKGSWEHREAFYAKFLRRAAYVIAGTNAGSEEIQRFYQVPSDRIKILPHPTPRFALNEASSNDPSEDVLRKYGISANYLFYPAQFWPHKNHAGLVLALRELRDRHNLSLSLVLVGSDKGNEPYIRRLANELELQSWVRFLGFVPNVELVSLYRWALALTYPSFFGPENLPPLEAFALGCPVIASSVAGAQEQLGDAALLVDPTCPGQIAAAVRSLHDDPMLRLTMIERGRKRALQWTAEHFVRGVLSILDEFEPVRRCWSS